MKRTILIYGLAIFAAALLLQWLQYRYVRVFSTEMFIGAVAVLFTFLGLWVGNRPTGHSELQDTFEREAPAAGHLLGALREVHRLHPESFLDDNALDRIEKRAQSREGRFRVTAITE